MSDNALHTKLAKSFDKGDFVCGASYVKLVCWYVVNLIFFRSGLVPFSNVLVGILRIFGAKIGREVRIKPHVQIKYPWKLIVGDNCWLGNCVIENLVEVKIGRHVCISQGALILTGNHNYNLISFELTAKPVLIEDGVWIGANGIVCPGVVVKSHAVLCVGSVATKDMEAHTIYQGNPAIKLRKRQIK